MLSQIAWSPRLIPSYKPSRISASSIQCQQNSSNISEHKSEKGRGSSWEEGARESYQVDISTGFPVAVGYSRPAEQQHWLSWRDQRARNLAARGDNGQHGSEQNRVPEDAIDQDSDVWPVYRASPYRAEAARQAQASTTTRILFVDEGHQCRSVLAQAIFDDLLKCYGRHLDIRVESASVGPAPPGEHDPRVVATARQARVSLKPRLPRVFDEVVDIVNFDLVLVLDHFDLTEVIKEVAVLDNINPGGLYAGRVKLLGRYSPKAAAFAGPPSLGAEDIPDPLYGNTGGRAELLRLRTSVQQIRASCRGLLQHLLDLDRRCRGKLPLQKALVQALQCPLLSGRAACAIAPRLHRRRAQRPVWREESSSPGSAGGADADAAATFYTIRVINGQQRVVRRSVTAKRGYWKDAANVEAELRKFMDAHGITGRMPSYTELREAGAYTLLSALSKHRGMGTFAKRLGLDMNQREKGYWADLDNLKQELASIASQRGLHNDSVLGDGAHASADEEGVPSLPQHASEDGMPGTAASGEAGEQLMEMPTSLELQRSGHKALVKAIHQWGGRERVARRLGLTCSPVQRLMTLGDLSLELEKAVPFVLQYGIMPSRAQLLEAGRTDLVQAVKRMGGFKRVAAALELAYLPARRGRSAAGAWSPGDVQSPLALVQFGSSQHTISISKAPLPTSPAGFQHAASEGSKAASGRSGQERERRAAQLSVEQRARSGGESESLGREVSHDAPRPLDGGARPRRAGREAAEGTPQQTGQNPAPGSRRRVVPKATQLETGRRAVSTRGSGFPGKTSTGGATAVPIPLGRPPFAIAMRGAAAGLGVLNQQRVQESENSPVAPLLKEVSAEVQHYVAASGLSRMPTRLELKLAGTDARTWPML
ncbi:probable low molecular weight phosphotyrosine protein phosphatase at N-terminal half [Coccomyxa sp. Obi]|nr:probable low molecular weight phosphotyrosine protein phosphatase at N-terminal half [Coccomyxa sp. Obi]